jgi:hypothetical protein
LASGLLENVGGVVDPLLRTPPLLLLPHAATNPAAEANAIVRMKVRRLK